MSTRRGLVTLDTGQPVVIAPPARPSQQPCGHRSTEPVILLTGETVAALCLACDVQLPAAWIGCRHLDSHEIAALADPARSFYCAGCGCTYSEEKLYD